MLASQGVFSLAPTSGPWGRWLDRAQVEVFGERSAERRVALLTPLRWCDPEGLVITVPEGLLSDGASVPRVAWWLMGGRLALDYIRAAFVHDMACRTRTAPFGSSTDSAVRFYRGLRADGMAFWKADLCRDAVQWFGPQWARSDHLFLWRGFDGHQ
ncbi:MAG: DUF1353 domain-containing protein [Caldilineaceae bacterium]